ncbi:MAG: VOC family protein [Bacteroidetes bacterium]|nr:VOC family protein [Bacteroidota bacterium]
MNYSVRSITPMLETKSMKDTLQFYTQILGFENDGYSEEWGWMSLKKNGLSIMFITPNDHRNFPEPIMSGSLYINTNEVDDVWNELKDKCKVCYPIEDFSYGMREFAIYDNNGYLLQFGKETRK